MPSIQPFGTQTCEFTGRTLMRKKTNHLKASSAWTLGLALAVLVACNGCGSKTITGKAPPPQDGSLCAAIGSGTMTLNRWSEKLTVLICVDVQGSTSTKGSFSGPPSVRKSEGSVTAKDGRKLEWRLEEKEGQKITCSVNDKEFDLDKGNLFLVKTKGGKTEIEQISQDLSAVKPDIESFKDFARKNPAISKLLQIEDK